MAQFNITKMFEIFDLEWWDIFGRKLLDTIRINPPYQVTFRYAYQYCLASIDMNGHEHSNQNGLMGNLFIWVIKKESKRFFDILYAS